MHAHASADVTDLLRAWSAGEPDALARLMPLVYSEMHSIAAAYLRRERVGHTLQATALIHETYLRLVERTHPNWSGRVHFFAAAAALMRRVLVDHARARASAKRGGGALRVALDDRSAAPARPAPDVRDLDRALDALALFDARKARAVELRYFGGLSVEETADVLGVSGATVRLDTRLARAWLQRELSGAAGA